MLPVTFFNMSHTSIVQVFAFRKDATVIVGGVYKNKQEAPELEVIDKRGSICWCISEQHKNWFWFEPIPKCKCKTQK